MRGVAALVVSGSIAALAGCSAASGSPAAAAAARSTAAGVQATPAVVHLGLNPADTCNIPDLRQDILQRINALRASGATCGHRRMSPAPPLAWNDVLFSAAARHSFDMAGHGYFDHVDPRGLGPSQRLTLEGYPWRSMAENIAGGDGSVASVMRGWAHSPPHCEAMLDPAFTQVGVACVERPTSAWGTYWSMELARPR